MLTERGGESAHLCDALAETVQGRGRVVLVTGGPGTGKSALVRTFAEGVDRREVLLLTATGSRTERTLELGVVSQLLREAPLDPGVLARVLSAVGGLHVTMDRDPAAPLPARVVNELSAALLGLVEQRPLVIVVDDLHHADNASRQVLLHLSQRARGARLLFVFTQLGDLSTRLPPLETPRIAAVAASR